MLHLPEVVCVLRDVFSDLVPVGGTIEQRPEYQYTQRFLQDGGTLFFCFLIEVTRPSMGE